MASLKEIRQRLGWAEDRLDNLITEGQATLDHLSQVKADLSEHITDDTTEPEPEPEPTPTEGDPELPRVTVSQALPEVHRSVRVTSEAELSDALAAVQPGDEIILSSSRTWGRVELPAHGGDGWATLRGEGEVPPPGQRIGPDDQVTTIHHDTSGGFVNVTSADGWYVYGLRGIPSGFVSEGMVAQSSARVVFDRVHVQAPGVSGGADEIRRGVRLNAESAELINSRIEGIIRGGRQSQGVGIWDGPGPFRIENNFIESLNQNVLVGGAKPSSLANNPSDGIIRRNHLYTRPSWRDLTGTIFVFEWKAGERWLCEENVVENDYQGFTVAVKAPSETQGLEGQRTGDITVRRNRYIGEFPGTGAYMLFRGASSAHREDASRLLLEDELWEGDRDGRAIRLGASPDATIIRRVTCRASHSSLELLYGAPDGTSPSLSIEGYRTRAGRYGIWLTDGEFPDGFASAYPVHEIVDYWTHYGDEDHGRCHRHSKIPESIDTAAREGLHCAETRAEIPAHVGADASALPDPAGIRDPDRPE